MMYATFLLDKEREVTLKIYNMKTKELVKVIAGPQLKPQGNHNVYFQITNFPNGEYFCEIESEGEINKVEFKIE